MGSIPLLKMKLILIETLIRKVEFHNFVKKIGMLMFSDATESYYGNQVKFKTHYIPED